jgi:putative DNA primase/helicase
MSPVQYGQRRGALAKALGTSLAFLDQEYHERRKRADGREAEVGDSFLQDPDPWLEPVDVADLLNVLCKTAKSHLVLPDGAAEALALWVLFSHAHDCFDISPVLGITSPTPECGKTTVLTFLGAVAPRPLPAANITPAAVFRAVEKWSPTVLIDEADTFLRDNNELRGILNSGHQRRNAYVVRTVGEDHEPKRFRTWGPKAVALIGKLPATLSSRAIHIEMRRKTAAERVTPLRLDRLEHLERLQRQAARWAQDNVHALRQADPQMPTSLHGRTADNWRPLIAIADSAGKTWADRVRGIAEKLTSERVEETAGVMLLEDISAHFEEVSKDECNSADLVAWLVDREDRPWCEWRGGKPLTQRQLARLLEPFGISPKQIWKGRNLRGYEKRQFSDAFTRYLGLCGNRSASPLDLNQSAIFCDFDPLASPLLLADRAAKKPRNAADSSVLADRNPPEGDFGDGDPFASLRDESLKLKPRLVGIEEPNQFPDDFGKNGGA